MENPTPFDLNAALRQWRENLAHSAAMKREDIDELEAHLRDSIAALEAKGLSGREAFWVARSRLGGDELVQEFGKVNRDQLWLNRNARQDTSPGDIRSHDGEGAVSQRVDPLAVSSARPGVDPPSPGSN